LQLTGSSACDIKSTDGNLVRGSGGGHKLQLACETGAARPIIVTGDDAHGAARRKYSDSRIKCSQVTCGDFQVP
jgi:hypothetical protein